MSVRGVLPRVAMSLVAVSFLVPAAGKSPVSLAIFQTSSTSYSPEVNFVLKNTRAEDLNLEVRASRRYGDAACLLTPSGHGPTEHQWMDAGERQSTAFKLLLKRGAIYTFYVSLSMPATTANPVCGVNYQIRQVHGPVLRAGFFRPGLDGAAVDPDFGVLQGGENEYSVAENTFGKFISIVWWSAKTSMAGEAEGHRAAHLMNCGEALAIVQSKDPSLAESALPASLGWGGMNYATLKTQRTGVPKGCELVFDVYDGQTQQRSQRHIPVVANSFVKDEKYVRGLGGWVPPPLK